MLLILSDLSKHRRAVQFNEAEFFLNQEAFRVSILMNVCMYTFTFETLEGATKLYTQIVNAVQSNHQYLDTGAMNLPAWKFGVKYNHLKFDDMVKHLESIDVIIDSIHHDKL